MADDVIRTERLLLRRWRESDLDAYFDIHSRWEVMRWLGNAPRVVADLDEARARLAVRAAPDPAGPPYGVWAVCEPDVDRPWGSVLLKPLEWSAHVDPKPEHRDVEIGWHLHPDVWGRGWASEGGAAMLERGRAAGLAPIYAITYPGNEPSQRVCARLGMTHLGQTDVYDDRTFELFRWP